MLLYIKYFINKNMPKEINISEKKGISKYEEKILEENISVKKDPASDVLKDKKEKEQTEKEISLKKKPSLNDTEIFKEMKPMNKWIRISLIVFAVLGVMGGLFAFYYFGIFTFVKDPSEVISFPTDYLKAETVFPSITFDNIKLTDPDEPRTEESVLNGKLFTLKEMTEMLKRRPVAVMIDNQVDARPQSGINSADIVYEALAEGGITRYMAIFWSEAPEKVGPIRSARNYFLEWLSPYDPVYIHDGCASSSNSDADACTNLYTYSIKDISTYGAWRWNDGVRISPHNEYSSVTNAWEYASTLDWDEFPDIESWSFKSDAKAEDRGDMYKVEVEFHQRLNNSGNYNVVWTYDSQTNTYLRRIGGEIDVDQETNTQVWAKNVVVQEVETDSAYDNTAHIVTETVGSGDAVFLIDGEITEGTWEKKTRTDRTTYYDSDGKEIVFNRGRIWIEMLSTDEGSFDIIKQ